MGELIHYIYSRPLWVMGIVILMCILMWTIINKVIYIKIQRRLMHKFFNFVLLCVTVIVVIHMTIFSRNMGEHEVCLVPFYSFVMAQEQSEMYRSMFMNILLFVPFGLSCPYVLKERHRGKIKVTILSAFLFSFCIEVLQFVFMLGRAEVDDVICNTLGALIGSLSFTLYCMLEKKNKD